MDYNANLGLRLTLPFAQDGDNPVGAEDDGLAGTAAHGPEVKSAKRVPRVEA